MSSLVPYCDSEEELFWGPITAKEIESDWRRMKTTRNKAAESNNDVEQSNSHEEISSNNQQVVHPVIEDSSKFDVKKTQSSNCREPMAVSGSSEEEYFETGLGSSGNLNSSTETTLLACQPEGTKISYDNERDLQIKKSEELEENKDLECSIKIKIIDNNEMELQVKKSEELEEAKGPECSINNDSGNIDNLNNSTIEKVRFRESTSSVISVKGDNRYEVYLPHSESMDTHAGSPKTVSEIGDLSFKFNDDNLSHTKVEETIVPIDDKIAPCREIADTSLVATESVITAVNDFVEVNLKDDLFDNKSQQEEDVDQMIDEEEVSISIDTQEVPPESSIEMNPADYDNLKTPMLEEKVVGELENKVESMYLNEPSENLEKSETVLNSDEEVTSSTCIDDRNVMSNLNSFSKGKEIYHEESSFYSPPGKKVKFNNNDANKNKENDNTKLQKSKIPVSGSTKLPILKPSSLNIERNAKDLTWSSEFKLKKVPKPKKPEYVVSPAKVGILLKFDKNKLSRPQSAGNLYQKPFSTPLQSNSRLYNTPQMVKPSSASKLSTPLSQNPPMKFNKTDSLSQLTTPPKNLKYKNVASPVADYINSSRTYIYGKTTHSNKVAAGPSSAGTTSKESSPKSTTFLTKLRGKE